MWGDAQFLSGSGLGGNDTFIFSGNFGNQNYVEDFHQGQDLIDITAAHGLNLIDFTITPGVDVTVVYLTADNVVTLQGFTGTLTHDDFVGLA